MDDNRAFLERRMGEELTRADLTNDEGLRTLHLRTAALYRQRLLDTGFGKMKVWC